MIVMSIVEVALEEFEEKCRFGTYKVRWWTAQGFRALFVCGGIGLTAAAAYGVISASIVATVSAASFGAGVAVVAIFALGAGFVRYKDLSSKMAEQEREDACNLIMPFICASINQQQQTNPMWTDKKIMAFLKSHGVTVKHMAPWIQKNVANHEEAGKVFARCLPLL